MLTDPCRPTHPTRSCELARRFPRHRSNRARDGRGICRAPPGHHRVPHAAETARGDARVMSGGRAGDLPRCGERFVPSPRGPVGRAPPRRGGRVPPSPANRRESEPRVLSTMGGASCGPLLLRSLRFRRRSTGQPVLVCLFHRRGRNDRRGPPVQAARPVPGSTPTPARSTPIASASRTSGLDIVRCTPRL
jgi:hypothetical protein